MLVHNISFDLNQKAIDILKFLQANSISLADHKPDQSNTKDLDLISYKLLSEYEGVNQNELKRDLANNRRKFELICVEPKTAGFASLAARDGRVDLVRLSEKSSLSIFNKRYARRLQENDKLVELDLSLFFRSQIAKSLRPLLRVLSTFSKTKLGYVLTNLPQNTMELRSYRGLQAIGRKIGLENTCTNPMHLLNRVRINRAKLEGRIPFPGVEITSW